jgi:hypothetical protein
MDLPARAICVDPTIVRAVWPRVEAMLAPALRDDDEFRAVAARVRDGSNLLWLASDGAEILAAVVTELYDEGGRKFCGIVACGGSEMARWGFLIGRLEQYARDEACHAVRINGRIGWARVFPEYRVKRVILEKEV